MFRLACSLSAVVCLILFAIFLAMPGSYLSGYDVAADAGGTFLGRRASPLFLGFGIMLWMLRDQLDAAVQRAVCWSMIATFVGVAMTGTFAFVTGVASQTILVAAVGELAIAAAFFVALRRV